MSVTGLAQRPIGEGLFTWPADEPRLLGSRCRACGEVTFPARRACPRCVATDVESHQLGTRGTLWTWTVQMFPPKPPYAVPADEFEPFGVGYIELPGELRVEARLTTADPDRLEIGMAMELTTIPVYRDGDTEVITYAFAPTEEQSR